MEPRKRLRSRGASAAVAAASAPPQDRAVHRPRANGSRGAPRAKSQMLGRSPRPRATREAASIPAGFPADGARVAALPLRGKASPNEDDLVRDILCPSPPRRGPADHLHRDLRGRLGRRRGADANPPRIADGNGDGMDLHLFRPAIDSKGFFSVNGADILGHNDLSLGLVLDYGHGLLPLSPGHGAEAPGRARVPGHVPVRHRPLQLRRRSASPRRSSLNGGDAGDGHRPRRPGRTRRRRRASTRRPSANLAVHAKLRILRPEAARSASPSSRRPATASAGRRTSPRSPASSTGRRPSSSFAPARPHMLPRRPQRRVSRPHRRRTATIGLGTNGNSPAHEWHLRVRQPRSPAASASASASSPRSI